MYPNPKSNGWTVVGPGLFLISTPMVSNIRKQRTESWPRR